MSVKAASKTWKEFSKGTSIHGFKYSTTNRMLDRIVWFISPIVSLLVASYLMLLMYERYKEEPTKTLYESQFVPVAVQTFTAVTICAPRRFTSNRIHNLINNTIMPNNVTYETMISKIPKLVGFSTPASIDEASLDILESWFQLNKLDPREVMEKLMVTCEEILIRCKWEGEERNCRELFKKSTILYGKCCSFNYDTDSIGNFTGITTEYFGPQMGLSVIVDPSTNFNVQVFHAMDSFRIILHGFSSYPGRNNMAVFLPLSSEIHLSFTPIVTRSAALIYNMDPKDRKCYFSYDVKLKYFESYSKSNCLLECEIKLCIKRCNCQPYMYPHDKDDVICQPKNIPCIQEHFASIRTVNWDECNCPAQCNDESNEVEVNTIPLKGKRHNPDPFYNEIEGNQSIVHVYYYKQTSTRIKRMVSSYWVDLVSNFGGVFNLFLGCSVLSILEMFYFLMVRYPRNLKH